MARTLTDQRHGAIGPVVYQGGRYGTVARARVTPINPRTINQQNARSILATVASEWRGLTDAVREAWKALGAQMPGKIGGFQAYVRINATLVTCGLAKKEEPPLIPALGIITCDGLSADDTPLVTLKGVVDTVAPDKFLVEAVRPVSPGINNVNAHFRLIDVVAGHAAPAVDLDLTEAYTGRFGAPVLGQRISVRITPMKDGFKGIPLGYSAIVAAKA
ncbi:MAG TPA: hypothetical protein VG167_02925 [Verrucomicrobiae bacterium]|nr:hypothetical protein [Verrucomicrobiae bacterium]